MVTNLDIIMGCLCCKTLPKLQNLMPMERKLNQMSRLKLYMVAIDNQKKKKRLGWKDYPSLDKASKSMKTNWMWEIPRRCMLGYMKKLNLDI